MLDSLNPEQLTAVTTMDRPVLVLSTAGTGKTHVLTAKAVYACDTLGYKPDALLSVTFTRKAANELRQRISAALARPDLDSSKLWIGTFHAICSRILRENPSCHPLRDTFTVIQTEEARRVMSSVIARLERVAPDDRRVSQILRTIDQIKGSGALISDDPANWPRAAVRPMASDLALIRAYMRDLAAMNCYDYGDLICETIHMLRTKPDVLAQYREQFRLITVDEYQDTDRAQQEWIRLMVGPNCQLTCVGDDDQSIYAFRGARVEAILTFGTAWPNAEIVTLKENYRCPADVLDRAAGMIEHNQNRHKKILRSANNKIGALHAVGYDAAIGMRRAMEQIIYSRDIELPWNAVAILGRTNEECNRIASDLAAASIPVHIFMPDANSSEYIQRLVAWIRMIVNSWDDAAFMTIADRVLGSDVVNSLYLQARMQNLPMLTTAIRNVQRYPNTTPDLKAFVAMVDAITTEAKILAPDEIIQMVIDKTNIERQVNNLPSAPKTKFWRLYQSLVLHARQQPDLKVVLEMAQNDLIDPDNLPDAVLISTMHGMKGLQAPIVISPGWDKGKFPRTGRNVSPADFEEERKIAFVTITRAAGDAWLLYDRSYGPSPFLTELNLVQADGAPISSAA